jgi:signal transduction histidine kinase
MHKVDKSQVRERILIVEDDPSIARVLVTLVGSHGDTVVVDGGFKAIELLRTQSFDLILTDYEMSQGTGMDVLEFREKQGIHTPVILITAFGTKELILESIKYRVFGFIEKPFIQKTVTDLVQKALNAYKEEEKVQNLAMLGTTIGEVVHEINNPLTALDLMIEWLEEEKEGEYVKKMARSIQKIKGIISSTQAQFRGTTKPSHTRFNLKESVSDAQEQSLKRALTHGVKVTATGDLNLEIVGNKDRVCQMIVNLLNNAIDAAAESEDKWVRIEILKETQGVKILITDSGRGIPNAIQAKLFHTAFSTKQERGMGLGLGIVRKLAKEHRGNVYLNAACQNTQFVISLPQ